jgi:hypothetical protein
MIEYEKVGDVWRVVHDCGCEVFLKNIRGLIRKPKTICQPCAIKACLIERNTKHSLSKTPTYTTWLMMKRRCNEETNNRYEYYGGKGIKVCDRWMESFANFYEDMGERPEGMSLDRVDLSLGYFKDNCRWVDDIAQANNKSNNNLLMRISTGEVFSVKRWCEIFGLKYKSVYSKLKYKKIPETPDEIFGEPFEWVQRQW